MASLSLFTPQQAALLRNHVETVLEQHKKEGEAATAALIQGVMQQVLSFREGEGVEL